jgi:hypothetical protein
MGPRMIQHIRAESSSKNTYYVVNFGMIRQALSFSEDGGASAHEAGAISRNLALPYDQKCCPHSFRLHILAWVEWVEATPYVVCFYFGQNYTVWRQSFSKVHSQS